MSMRSERARLTLLYAGLLVLAGSLLTALVFALVEHNLYTTINDAVVAVDRGQTAVRRPGLPDETTATPTPPGHGSTEPLGVVAARGEVTRAAENATLDRLLAVSLAGLAGYVLLSAALAWWAAGRVLRPIAVIAGTARRLSGENLHERIAMKGPPGELKRLADAFDAMLERVEHLVLAQQRFAAHAAHELRTPLAVHRAAAEIGLAGRPDAATVAHIRRKLLSVADDSERTIEALLLLATAEQGIRDRVPVAVHDLLPGVVEALAREAAERHVDVSVHAEPLTVAGDAVLLERLLHNLLANAVRHNRPGGSVEVWAGAGGVTVTNTGVPVPERTVPLLFEPFHRAEERRHRPGEGAGLGLSIARAIARSHGARISARANPSPAGGLTVTVDFAQE